MRVLVTYFFMMPEGERTARVEDREDAHRREHPGIDVGVPHIPWALDDGIDYMLPAMKSDVALSRSGCVLIVDAKYYAHATQRQFDRHTVHSANLYQIYAYVKNKEAELEIQPEGTYRMSGNRISVGTLELDQPFDAMTIGGYTSRIVLVSATCYVRYVPQLSSFAHVTHL